VRVALLVALLAARAWAGTLDAKVIEHHGRWESGYGAKFYNVVGRLQNTSDHALRFVKLRVDAVDEHGKVVASTDTYNESAEALAVPELKADDLLASGKVKPLAAHAEERFRASFLAEETPAFTDYRVTVVETPPAK
jgi:hypothetical protein